MLSAVFGHPGASAFVFAGEEVGVEDGEETVLFVVHFKGVYLFMVFGEVVAFREGDAVKPVRQVEDASLYVFKPEVGFQHFVVYGIFFLFQAVRVICPVPAAQRFGETVAACIFLHFPFFRESVRVGGFQQLSEEAIDRLRGLRHAVCQCVVRVIAVPEQTGFFQT